MMLDQINLKIRKDTMKKRKISERAAIQRLKRFLVKQNKRFIKTRNEQEYGFIIDVATGGSSEVIFDYADFEQLLRSYGLIRLDEEL